MYFDVWVLWILVSVQLSLQRKVRSSHSQLQKPEKYSLFGYENSHSEEKNKQTNKRLIET